MYHIFPTHSHHPIWFVSGLNYTSPIWCPLDWLLNATTLIPPLVLPLSYPSLASLFGTPHWFDELWIKCPKALKHTLPIYALWNHLKAHLTNSMILDQGLSTFLIPLLVLTVFSHSLASSTSTPCHFYKCSHPAIQLCTMWDYSPWHQPHPLAWRLICW